MKVVVCVKQVSAVDDEVEFTTEGLVDPDVIERSFNEWDAVATEQALQLRDSRGGGEVLVVSVGGVEADAVLRRCLAMGADRALRIDADDHDPLQLARLIADALANEAPDLVLCGAQSSDAVQGAVGTMLAELLGFARVVVVTNVRPAEGSGHMTVERELEGGLREVVDVALPALLTMQTGAVEPRYVTLRAIKQAEEVELETSSPSEAGQAAYRVRRMYLPERESRAESLGSDAVEIAARIKSIVQERLG